MVTYNYWMPLASSFLYCDLHFSLAISRHTIKMDNILG